MKKSRKIIRRSPEPRLRVFRSNKHIYAQLIDNAKGQIIVFSSDLKLSSVKSKTSDTKSVKLEKAHEVGANIAKMAKSKKITKVIFDRAGYNYHGRIKSLAEGAREGGLIF
ncbi:50S ribosomal protein L18 [Candidatus Curtissbacteria bacterium RBG_13_40_7]|uniref:Large ribosomal subunit protein uL18 n=1 Tax=Candidatus Curtissbacteria bacterium RBG_13_40_7 TaxID=1797706 RepID=A0A1F5FX52_9BACT|nr:MAG: 50S ribosomal protein L18 [Candidatus Curtissbacteria bacterium RBG_13_40_7]